MKQKALNVAVALAFGAVAAPSLAGTISVTPRQFPASLFGTPALTVAPVAYSVSAPLAAGVTRYLYIKLDNGSKFAAGTVAAADFKLTDPSGAAVVGTSFGTPVFSADSTFIYVPITSTTTPAPINSTIAYTPEAGAVINTGALATVGQVITATASLGNSPSTSATAADADAASNGPVAVSVNPFTITIIASSSSSLPFGTVAGVGNEKSQINVTTAGALNGEVLTNGVADLTGSTSGLDFGSLKVSLAPNLFKADGTALTVATDAATKLSFTVAGAFNAFATASTAASFKLSDSAADVTGVSANAIPATTITSSTISFTNIPLATAAAAGTVGAGTQYYFVGNTDGATLIQSTTPVVSSATFSGVGGSSTSVPTAASLYALGPNGGIVTVPTYVPAAVGGGYVSYYRVINTGSLAAAPSVQVISEAGVSGPAAPLGFTVQPSGVHIFSSSDIEAAVGAVSASTRPRLRFTATTTIQVQTLLTNPNGTLTTLDTFN